MSFEDGGRDQGHGHFVGRDTRHGGDLRCFNRALPRREKRDVENALDRALHPFYRYRKTDVDRLDRWLLAWFFSAMGPQSRATTTPNAPTARQISNEQGNAAWRIENDLEVDYGDCLREIRCSATGRILEALECKA